MPELAQLKQKYQPVVDAIQNEGGQLQNVNMDGNQLYLKASMPSEDGKNRVWDAIKSVDATFADLKHGIEVGSGGASTTAQSGSAQGNRYTVQTGDNLEVGSILQQYTNTNPSQTTSSQAASDVNQHFDGVSQAVSQNVWPRDCRKPLTPIKLRHSGRWSEAYSADRTRSKSPVC